MVIIAIVTFISVLIIDISTIASFLLLLFNVFPVSHGTSLKVTNSFSLHRTISLFSCSAFRSSSERKNKLDHVCIFMFSFPDNFFFSRVNLIAFHLASNTFACQFTSSFNLRPLSALRKNCIDSLCVWRQDGWLPGTLAAVMIVCRANSPVSEALCCNFPGCILLDLSSRMFFFFFQVSPLTSSGDPHSLSCPGLSGGRVSGQSAWAKSGSSVQLTLPTENKN